MKKIKVFRDGVYLRDIYPHATRFQVLKYRIAQWIGRVVREVIRWTKLGLATSLAFAVGAFIFGNFTGVTTQVVFAGKDPVDRLPAKVEALKEQVLSDLSLKCEINGMKPEDGAIIFDTNGKASIGQFMFQKKTVIHYYSVLYKKDITGQQAVDIANDTQLSHDLAKDVIFNTDNGLTNWVNCDKKLGLKAKVDFIKQLEK